MHRGTCTCTDRAPLCLFCSDAYLAAQRAHSWQQGKAVENYHEQVDNGRLRVGVMGAGHMGTATLKLLLAAGYPVSCWTRTARHLESVRCFHGSTQLQQFAEQCHVVVSLVPHTPETR